jgi:Arc/MetJ-type ribon-helix-helix transcriptional regulator
MIRRPSPLPRTRRCLTLVLMTTITFRTDPETDAALVELSRDGLGADRSAVIREAIKAAADTRRRQDLRQEAARLATDPADLAEIAAVQLDMEHLRAW